MDSRRTACHFTVPRVLEVADLCGDPCRASLVLFMAGNQFMVMPPLVDAFIRGRPSLQNQIFYETLPPGILEAQLADDGRLAVGSLRICVAADVVAAGRERMHALASAGHVDSRSVRLYATNRLALVVRPAAAGRVQRLADLAAADLRVALPDPAHEGIGRRVLEALKAAGGEALVNEVSVRKVTAGCTRFTRMHHREIPLWLGKGECDAGLVWRSEALWHSSWVVREIPEDSNPVAEYLIAATPRGAAREPAQQWLAFLLSDEAQSILRTFHFGPPRAPAKSSAA